jgi:hypothetical protein
MPTMPRPSPLPVCRAISVERCYLGVREPGFVVLVRLASRSKVLTCVCLCECPAIEGIETGGIDAIYGVERRGIDAIN